MNQLQWSVLISYFYIRLAKQSRDVVGGLIEDKVELSIGLVHLVSFQQAETGSSQQMVLSEPRAYCIYTYDATLVEPQQFSLIVIITAQF